MKLSIRIAAAWALALAIGIFTPVRAQSDADTALLRAASGVPVTESQPSTPKLTTLFYFNNANVTGLFPFAGLIQGNDGRLYGTVQNDGPNAAGGTVYKISTTGAQSNVYAFCSQVVGSVCADGSSPYVGGLVQGKDGNFYGTTPGGGNNSNAGTVFKVTPTGTHTTLYSFCPGSSCTDGADPYAALVQGTDGNFYGTTVYGGSNNSGTVFKITPGGALTTLHSFIGTDGSSVQAGLVQGTDGNFYGVTGAGGLNGGGTIFKITPAGTLTTIYNFCSQSLCSDGDSPLATLIQATNGKFYGTTYYGGTYGYGAVYQVTSSGALNTIFSFCSQSAGTDCLDGGAVLAPLVQGTDGNFYGTTEVGGANGNPNMPCGGQGCGTIFKLTPSGTLTTLYSFCQTGLSPCADGNLPYDGLVQDTNGILYGTTYQGGSANGGTVFSLSVGLGPFVKTAPTSGKVGSTVKILGTNLTGSTSVTFNGVAAAFQVVSASQITATVPSGATTGKVKVVTKNSTLTSNVNFRIP